MVQAPVLKFINQHIEAVGLCVRDGLAGPALVLTYVGIDAFGMLGRPVRRPANSRKDFIAWAERYMISPRGLPFSGLELYGARCGVLHTLGAESKLSEEGRIRRIFYAHGDRDPGPVNAKLAWVAKTRPDLDAVMVKVTDITDAFILGVANFGRDVDSDPALQAVVIERSAKLFGQFARFPGAA
jgi:hypothetical protein